MPEPGARKLITCFLPKGKGGELVGVLNDEHGIASANVTSGRGRGVAESVSFGAWVEVDILSVVVGADVADEVFALIYEKGELDRPNGGLMFQVGLSGSTEFVLPEIVAEEG